MKKILLLMFALITTVAMAFADDTTITWSASTDWTTSDTEISYAQAPYTVTITKGEDSKTAPAVNATSNEARAYALNVVTVSTTGEAMTKIVFTIPSSNSANLAALTASTGEVVVDATALTATWTGEATEVSLTVSKNADNGTNSTKAGQFRFTQLVVTAGAGGGTVDPNPDPDPDPVVTKSTIFSESFSADLGEFTTNDVTLPEGLTYVWSWGGSNYGAKASAYVNKTYYATESWLISPAIDLSKATESELTFSQCANFFSSVENFKAACSVKVREAETGEWADLAYEGDPTGTSWTWTDGVKADLSAYDGKKVQVAFVYTSTTEMAGTWEVKNFVVSGVLSEPVETVNAPVASPAAGTYTDEVEVTLTADEGCTIYYTVDGTTPTTSSARYTAPFTLDETTTVKAIAVNENGTASDDASFTYTIKSSPVAPENGVIFNFNANEWNLPISDGETTTEVTGPIEEGGVTLTCTSGTVATRMWNDYYNGTQLRVYKSGGSLTFTAPTGRKIVKIEFDASKFDMTAKPETLTDKVWEGEAESVTFTANGTSNINYVIVTLDSSTGISTAIADGAAVKSIFSLDGRKLTAPVKGINIINGKKVMVK